MGGVQRPLKFVKYLPEFGWRPVVLTVKPVSYYVLDESLLREVTVEANVLRTGSLDPLRFSGLLGRKVSGGFGEARARFKPILDWLAIPDLSLGWLPFAVFTGFSALRSRPIEVILATAPPFSSHLTGMVLSRMSGLPLVLDYRDAWTHDSPRVFPTDLHFYSNRWLERKSLAAAVRILTVNVPIARGLCSALSVQGKDRVQVLPLGYDPDDFRGIGIARPMKLRISHVGTLIGERSPRPLLDALRRLFESHPETRNDLEVRFVGHHRPGDERMIQESGLADVVTCLPYLPHRESIAELLSAHALYLVIGAREGETISTGKLYEYLGAKKPILASAPHCEAARTIKETGTGWVCHPSDSEGLAHEIFRLYSLHKTGRLFGPSQEAVRRYDRRELTRELAGHLSEVA